MKAKPPLVSGFMPIAETLIFIGKPLPRLHSARARYLDALPLNFGIRWRWKNGRRNKKSYSNRN